MNRPDTVYGELSLGSGAILSDKSKLFADFADPLVIADYQRSIEVDLKKSGITKAQLSNWEVMDCGTGRQSVALLNLGAKKVSHFDLSPRNVSEVIRYRDQNKLEQRLDSRCCDIVSEDLGSEKYDFIYLNGIVQHFSHVGKGITNCLKALKNGGLFWLYFYRAGTFHHFVVYLLRDLVHGSNIAQNLASSKEYYDRAQIAYKDFKARDFMVSSFMDSVFTTYAHLFYLNQYVEFCRQANLEIVSSSGADPWGRNVDHEFARPTVILTVRKRGAIADLGQAQQCLSPENAIDELSPQEPVSQDIHEMLKAYRHLHAKLLDHPSRNMLIPQLALAIYQQVLFGDDSTPQTERFLRSFAEANMAVS